MIKKISNEFWYSTITSKCYLSAELAEKAETCVYADVLNNAYLSVTGLLIILIFVRCIKKIAVRMTDL